ncbi:MAG: hypothetical protein C5B49_14000 [Bdellovibrio sp.]|nr:MAG: hypothetical protein C5B49_14000 [Bdellovibrio sp.]
MKTVLLITVLGGTSIARADNLLTDNRFNDNLFTKEIQEFGAIIQEGVDENARLRGQIKEAAGFDGPETPTRQVFVDQDAPEEIAVPATSRTEASTPESDFVEETLFQQKIRAAAN